MFYFSAARLFSISSLIFSVVILAAPTKPDAALVVRSGTCVVGCTGINMLNTLTMLNEDLQLKYQELDKYRANGADLTGVLEDIQASVKVAHSQILGLDKDLTGLNNGKNEQIGNEFMKLFNVSVICLDPVLTADLSDTAMNYIDVTLNLVGEILKELPGSTNLGKEAKKLLEKIKVKAKDFWKQIIDIIGGNDEEF
ncbi:unnamed protein product [Rhizoctonia solani]|uniref:Uncharacterized protein n=1 Tax=Rhizoctonia solani TaxID=456999 RepID=A0A8H3GRV2_9AGAM|nr:unnamed protein product [Rhizoctonia solani]